MWLRPVMATQMMPAAWRRSWRRPIELRAVVGTEECAVKVGGDHPDLHGASLAVNVR